MLRQKQSEFALNVVKLLKFMDDRGYEFTLGEVYRPSYVQRFLIKIGKSWTKNSQHSLKLAIDVNLFKNGKYLSSSSAHHECGKYWESLSLYNVWGGRFRDGNHYEMRHDLPRNRLRRGKYHKSL